MSKGIAARRNFDPAQYKLVGSFYLGDSPEMRLAYKHDMNELAETLGEDTFKELLEKSGRCQSCGTVYNHGMVVDGPQGLLTVGHICGTEYFGLSSVYELRARAAAKIKERNERRREAEAFIAEHNLAEVFEHTFLGDPIDKPEDGDYYSGYAAGTTFDIRRKLLQYGSLSDAQVALLHKLHAEHHARQAERAAEPATVAIPSEYLDGRVTISGTVLSVKFQEGPYGTTQKMLVAVDTDGGRFKLWGSVPSGLDTYDHETGQAKFVKRGDKVQFDAKVEVSKSDETFGYFSRPTKAKWING